MQELEEAPASLRISISSSMSVQNQADTRNLAVLNRLRWLSNGSKSFGVLIMFPQSTSRATSFSRHATHHPFEALEATVDIAVAIAECNVSKVQRCDNNTKTSDPHQHRLEETPLFLFHSEDG